MHSHPVAALLQAAAAVGAHSGSNAAFKVVFGIFLAALVVMAFITLRWAIRRDRSGLADWRRRRAALGGGHEVGPGDGDVRGNGAHPHGGAT